MEKRKEPVQMENKVLQTGEFVGERIDRFLPANGRVFPFLYSEADERMTRKSGRKGRKGQL